MASQHKKSTAGKADSPEERLKAVRAMAKRGASDKEIGLALGLSKSGVASLRRRSNIATGHPNKRGRTHGVTATYKDGCRCDKCTQAATTAGQMRRAKARDRAPVEDFKHGATAYTYRGCRCETCTTAHSQRTAPANERRRKQKPDSVKAAQERHRARTQLETIDVADRNGLQWTGPELEIASRDDLKAKEAALMLGRTYFAVITVRHLLRKDPKTEKLAGLPAESNRASARKKFATD